MQITQLNATFWAVGRRALSALFVFTALAGLFVSAPRAAQAQGRRLLPLRLKLGVYLPSDRDTRDLSGSRHLSGEIDVALPRSSSGERTLLSVGYSYKGSNIDGFRRSYQVIPVSLTQISSPPNPANRATGNIYYGAGVGLYFVKAFGITSPTSTRTSPSGVFIYSKNRTLIGASLVAGYETPSTFFVEGKYHVVTGTVEGYSPNGLSLFIGKRL